jgi:O-antigen/teichoic acid export membrane protein
MHIKNLKTLLLENTGIKQTIIKNTFWLTLAEIFTRGVNILILIWLARHFGLTIYGQWTFALSFVAIFSVLADFGFSTLTIREIARDKLKSAQYIDNILAMKFVFGLITIALVALIIQFLEKDPNIIKLVCFLSFYVVLNTFSIFFQSIFRANEKMQYVTVCRAIQGLSLLILSAFFITAKASILIISYAYIGAALIGVLFSLIFVWRYFSKFFIEINLNVCKEIFKNTLPFFLSGIFFVIYIRAGSVMLGIFSDMEQVGYFNAAYNIYAVMFILPEIITASFFPKLSYFYKENISKLEEIFRNFRLILGVSGFFLGITLFIFSGFLISNIYPEEYLNSIIILEVFSAIVLFRFLTHAYDWFLMSVDEQTNKVKIQGFCAFLNIILTYFLIMEYNALGAVIATLITELFLLSFYYFYSKKKWSVMLRNCKIAEPMR